MMLGILGVQGPKGQMTLPIPSMVEIRQVQKTAPSQSSEICPYSC